MGWRLEEGDTVLYSGGPESDGTFNCIFPFQWLPSAPEITPKP